MKYRFFIVEGGPAIDAARKARADREKAISEIMSFRDSIGAKEAVGNTAVTGFQFSEQPDLKIWREVKGYWRPRKNTKAGKELASKLASLPKVPRLSNAVIEALGLPSGPVIFTAGYAYLITAVVGLNTVFIKAPWLDVDPEELAQYRLRREKGAEYRSNLDYLLTDFHTSMIEVREWEWLKALEDAKKQSQEQSK